MVQVGCCVGTHWNACYTSLCVLVACATVTQLRAASAGPYMSTNSVMDTAEQLTDNGYWLEQYNTFTGSINSMESTYNAWNHGKEPQLQISPSVYPQPNPSGSNTRPSPILLVPKLRI